jgi:hypothetical protein
MNVFVAQEKQKLVKPDSSILEDIAAIFGLRVETVEKHRNQKRGVLL